MAQQKIENPAELLHYQIRSALTMEQHSLEALEELELAARDSKIKKLFSHHSDETREQIANLEKAFALLFTRLEKAIGDGDEHVTCESKT